MISTFDQMSGGRICINLIAGQNESEVEGEGVRYAKEERYALMEEEVSILKALWTTRGPLTVTVDAECTAVKGRKVSFQVRAHDGVDLIGEGRHERAVVAWQRFNERVASKARAAGESA